MSYTAIPPQDITINKPISNGYIKRTTLQSDRSSSLKSPASVSRRLSNTIVPNTAPLRKSAPDHQEIYEGFTFLDEQRRKNNDFCPFQFCPTFTESSFTSCDILQSVKCSSESINPFAFKNPSLERIYVRYYSLVYRSTLLSRFFLLTALLCFVLAVCELVPTFSDNSPLSSNIRCWISFSMVVTAVVPLIHIHCQTCMRPQHLSFLKFIGFILCCGIVIAVSPIWGKFNSENPSIVTVGLWETVWLVILISSFFPVTFYTLLALTIFLCVSHSVITILVIIVSGNTTFSSVHWAALSGNWLLFISSILLGGAINYLQQKLLRNAFLHTREFLNNCVETKIANEKLNRLLACIAPQPILPELKQNLLVSYSPLQQLPSVVHLRNVSFINVEINGLSKGMKCDGGSSSFPADIVKLMNELFSRFDMLGQELGCYRIRAHPDDYLCLAGYPETRVDHAKSCTELAFRIQHTVKQLSDTAEVNLEIRTVVHTGVTYGAVIGHSRMMFDLLGDDIRVLKHMLSVSTAGKVMVSKTTYDQLPDTYRGIAGPILDLPLISMSMSASGDSTRLETFFLRPKNAKQSSILNGVDFVANDPDECKDQAIKEIRKFPLLTSLPDTSDESGKQTQRSGSYPPKAVGDGDKAYESQLTRSGQSDSLSSNLQYTMNKAIAYFRLAQSAKFNAYVPYYFLHDESLFFSTPDEDRFLLDLGHTVGNSPIPINTGSPLFHGTTKSSVSWKSTLRSQLTQSLIGSYQIDEDDIAMKNRPDFNLTMSRVTGVFNEPTVELRFQNYSETFMGYALLICLSSVLLATGVHALLLARTVILLLLFLVIFMWISLILLFLLLVKMKCLSTSVIRSKLFYVVVLTITCLGMFALFSANSFCCNSLLPEQQQYQKTMPMTKMTTIGTTVAPEQHLSCPLPLYIPLTTIWVILPLIVMFALPAAIKIVITLSTVCCTTVLIFWTHLDVFKKFSKDYRTEGIPMFFNLGITVPFFFVILIVSKSRIFNSFRRLVYQWSLKTEYKHDEYQKLLSASDTVLNILVPKFISVHLLHSSRNILNLYSAEHKLISVMSVSIPTWCPIRITEPSDVANNIRLLNQVLVAFDDVIATAEFDGIVKIRTAGETAWFAVGVNPQNPIESTERACAMLSLLRAAEMFKLIVEEHNLKHPDNRFLLRIGIHCGSGFSGIIGGTNPEYGVWGEAYFGATLVQKYGQLDRIHVTSNFASEIDPSTKYSFFDVGNLNVNYTGQLISIAPGQWVPGMISLRVLVLRDKNSNNNNITPTNLIPISDEESNFAAQGGRNSLAILSGPEMYNQVILSTAPHMQPPNPVIALVNTHTAQTSSTNNNSMFSTSIPNQNKASTAVAYCTPPVLTAPVLNSPLTPIISASNANNCHNSSTATGILPIQVSPLVAQHVMPTDVNIMSKSQPDYRKSASESRPKIHHYRNLATELPDSVIPPSPPPHRRTYSDNVRELENTYPPMIPPRNSHYCDKPVGEPYVVPQKERAQMTQSAINSQHDKVYRIPKSLTPSSSMDSFLELEKACSTNPRTKSATYCVPPSERLSLIPEVYRNMPETDLLESDVQRDIDMSSMDVMTTSDDRVFDIDQSDIMSHHNPMYTDNEYESMAESQLNLLDPMEEIRRSRLINARHNIISGNPIMRSMDNTKFCPVGLQKIPDVSEMGIFHDLSLDFPDYRRPDSPNAPGNGDDSDHLSKKNRNSSNSRDSSSIAARRSGGGQTSSDESGQKRDGVKSKYEDSEINSISNEVNYYDQSNKDNGQNQSQGINDETYMSAFIPHSVQSSVPGRKLLSNSYDNASSCMSVVTDFGWTSYDDEDLYSDYPGYSQKNHAKGFAKKNWSSKWSESNDIISSHNHIDEDDSDLDCIRVHSDLVSDYSENPLVSDLDNETDTEFRSTDMGPVLVMNECRNKQIYKFPAGNLLNSEFFNKNGLNGGGKERLSDDLEINGGIFAAHPWTHNDGQQNDDCDIYSLPSSRKDEHSSASSKTPQKDCDRSLSSRLPSVAPVRMPDFSDFKIARDAMKQNIALKDGKSHGRSLIYHSDLSEYDNVSGKNSLNSTSNNIRFRKNGDSVDQKRFISGDDSDAMSGYIGDVASSVYDSDEDIQQQQNRITQLYLDYDLEHEDPMAPFFPRLPPEDKDAEPEKAKQIENLSTSGSRNGMRSDYDNIDSEKGSGKEDEILVDIENKAIKSTRDFQKQIAAEARKISDIFQNQWTNGISDSDANNSEEHILDYPTESEGDEEFFSKIANNYGLIDSAVGCSLTALEENNKAVLYNENQHKSQSTDCVLGYNGVVNGGLSVSKDSLENDVLIQRSTDNELLRFRQRAEKVKSLLPPELHPYILPGCFSNSSLNSSSDASPILPPKAINSKSLKDKTRKSYYSDEDRLKQTI